MKKYFSFVIVCVLISIFVSSCGPTKSILPTATSTINSVRLDELNLDRKDYQVTKKLTAEATIYSKEVYGVWTIYGDNQEFSLTFRKNKQGAYEMDKFSGIFKMGFLSNDYGTIDYDDPHGLVRRLAIYRIINLVQSEDGDGIIEPVISTNVEQIDRNTVAFKTTVSGKMIKIKENK